ncbi:TetR/AcrR family transcriptional regulator C-terminal domain-containing protein [Pseudonocardia sp. GCM10023141]|uniref:TetR/AcrR family transcriptional regulator C-terminal domain-containing protein n=1 Tax=Pseudonocardia sp. GCM10023141 TaxID=3252653 RepID=UPI00361A6CAE
MSRRDEVLQAAIELLDEVGLDDLTTRRLAARLGVQPGALYRHFTSKQALLDAIVEQLVTLEPPPPATQEGWAEQVSATATVARAGMLAHRDGARLVATMGAPGPSARAGFERLVAVIAAGGAPAEAAMLATDTVFAYVNGFTIEEQARKVTGPSAVPRSERDRQFAAGLGLIIDGIRAALR